jgi:tetratricopeptide (TPR) repeat protein
MKTTLRLALVISLAVALPRGARAESFASMSAKAQKADKAHDAMSALEDYGEALHLWKKSDGKKAKAKVLAARAAIYEASGSAEAALADLSAAVKVETKTSTYFYRRGKIYYDMGRDTEAISDFYKATQLNLEYKQAYLYRGFAYERSGDAKFAREDYRTACKLGLKEACTQAARAKALAAAAAGPASENFQAAQAQAPVVHGPVEVKKGRKRRAYKLDWKACLDGLTACTDAGGAFSPCVYKAPVCEKQPVAGCCPQECVTRFRRMVDDTSVTHYNKETTETDLNSEGASFREVFNEDSTCAKP